MIDQHNETIAGLEAAMRDRWERIRALEAENAGMRNVLKEADTGLRAALAMSKFDIVPDAIYKHRLQERIDLVYAALNAGETGGST